MGRLPRRGPDPQPFTPGLLDDLQPAWKEDVLKWLPALWFDCGSRTGPFRDAYARVVRQRIDQVFYQAQRTWCADHGIALTGHPELSNEMSSLSRFHWPGQDLVWRWVLPNTPSALEGPDSVAPKVASSAASIHGNLRNVTELFGAYGWRLNPRRSIGVPSRIHFMPRMSINAVG